MLQKNDDPTPLLVGNSLDLQVLMVQDVMQEEGIVITKETYYQEFFFCFMGMVEELSLTDRAELFSNRMALASKIRHFAVEQGVDLDQHTPVPHDSIPWIHNDAWEEIVCPQTLAPAYVNEDSHEQIDAGKFRDWLKQGIITPEKVSWLSYSELIEGYKDYLAHIVTTYSEMRRERNYWKPRHPVLRWFFMRHSYCPRMWNPVLQQMMSERNFGTFQWNYGCIMEVETRHGRRGRRLNPFHTISYRQRRDLALEVALSLLDDNAKSKKKWKQNLIRLLV